MPHIDKLLGCCYCFVFACAALFSVLDGNSSLDDSARKALKRRLNPVVDLAAAAQDSMTADGYGLAHNSVRSDAVSHSHTI